MDPTVVSKHQPDALLDVDEARTLLLAQIGLLAVEEVVLSAALGRVLREDVCAAGDLPGIDNSSMDGYAVVAADVVNAGPERPARLMLGDEARIGAPRSIHRRGTATPVMTGAPIPRGADTVIPVEDTRLDNEVVGILSPLPPGTHIRARGEDASAGTVLLRTGRRLRAVDVGVCAAAGRAAVRVSRRPRVALMSSGDELVPPGSVPAPHQVRDSNTTMLAAAVREAGGVPVLLGVAADDPAIVSSLLERGAGADLIVTNGGVSMGVRDHIRECVARLGRVDGWRVAIRPGKPLIIGRVGATPMIGLPGNPVSSAVTFLLFARPAILALQGAAGLMTQRVRATLTESCSKPASLTTYLRVRLDATDDGFAATPSGGQGSAMLHALAGADALAILPRGGAEFPAGTAVEALLIP